MREKLKDNLFLLLSALFIFLLFAANAKAFSRPMEVHYPKIFGQSLSQNPTLPEYIKYIYNISFIVIIAISLGTAIWGGLVYFFSTGNPEKIKGAKNQIFGSVIGIIILFSSYLILYNINPSLLILNTPQFKKITLNKKIPSPGLIKVKNPTLIAERLPLGEAIRGGLWQSTEIEKTKEIINALKSFLEKKITINDPEIRTSFFERISDLNKYLKTVTDECRCENLLSFCTKPETGAFPIGCSGDPCQSHSQNKKNGLWAGQDSPRAKIDNVLKINREKIKYLLAFKKEIDQNEKEIRNALRKYQTIEKEFISCQTQKKGVLTLNEYLSLYSDFKKINGKLVDIQNYYNNPGQDNLTRSCSEGGTIYDYPYSSMDNKSSSEESDDSPQSLASNAPFPDKISCPVKIPVGATLGNLKDMAIFTVFQLKRISSLSNKMANELQRMAELVSKCNEASCHDSCACVPNPCYHKCHTIICTLFCHSRCLQSVGGCHGAACPVKDIEDETKEIKKTDDSLLDSIGKINEVFPKVKFALSGEDNPYNLKRINIMLGLCYSPDTDNPSFGLLSCNQAKGNYGPNGMLITGCSPQNFYCCSFSENNKMPTFFSNGSPSPTFIVPPLKTYQPLPEENNCPKGWRCRHDVSFYNQYNDASQPLKELLSCMREKLDKFQKERDIKGTIGIISSISDSKLYKGTCSWESGPVKEGGCSHIYEVERGMERISSHYGGSHCNYEEKSYAVDISLSSDFQRKYADEIIKAAKKCEPGVYILDELSHLHIDIARIYGCK